MSASQGGEGCQHLQDQGRSLGQSPALELSGRASPCLCLDFRLLVSRIVKSFVILSYPVCHGNLGDITQSPSPFLIEILCAQVLSSVSPLPGVTECNPSPLSIWNPNVHTLSGVAEDKENGRAI